MTDSQLSTPPRPTLNDKRSTPSFTTHSSLEGSAGPSATSSVYASSPEGSPLGSATTLVAATLVTATHCTTADTSTTEITYSGAIDVQSEIGQDGGLSVLPAGSRTRRETTRRVKVKQLVKFKERSSAFDRFNPASGSDPFRGFYTLFWIVMAATIAQTLEREYSSSGKVVGLELARLLGEDVVVLALSDAALVGSTFLCVPFIKLIERGWIRYYYTGLIIQHVAQAVWLGLWIRWTFFRQWPWVQSGFLTLHSISMLMKIHSYCSINGDLSVKSQEAKRLFLLLEELVSARGGWDKVVREAEEIKADEELTNQKANDVPPLSDPDVAREGLISRSEAATRGQISASEGLHRRHVQFAKEEAIASSQPSPSPHIAPSLSSPTQTSARLLLVGSHHLDKAVSDLAKEVRLLMEDLTSTVDTRKGSVTWPANVTAPNFWDYLLVPTLVYELSYPRTKTIRPLYILEKVAATFGTFTLIYVITQYYVWDVYPKPGDNFFYAYQTLMLPFMVNYLLIFYIIFECICNAFAEITRFADREFYADWWNSTSFDEFARKWNKPVHSFLLQHVYASTINAYGLSKSQAALVTFFLSALMHELLMAVVTKKLRMYLFAMQMAQLPLIAIGELEFIKKNPALGNLFFWIGLMSGFPLLGVCYILY